MIFDKQSLLSDAQAITATAVSTNVIDLQAMGTVPRQGAALARDEFAGDCVPLLVQVVEGFATLTSLTITLECSDNSDLSSSTVVATSPAIPAASLKAGYRWNLDEPPEGVTKRYLGLRYTVGGSNATAGKVTAGFVAGRSTPGR